MMDEKDVRRTVLRDALRLQVDVSEMELRSALNNTARRVTQSTAPLAAAESALDAISFARAKVIAARSLLAAAQAGQLELELGA